MSLTAAQIADVRRYCGYPALGDFQASDVNDPALGAIANFTFETLDHRLRTLRTEEETILISKFLTPLGTLEDAIPLAGANLDTESASVWKRNASEVADRTALYNQLRRAMCGFLGFEPGPALGDGSFSLMRG